LSEISFENYGRRARDLKDPTCVAGRYALQATAERQILPDVAQKLQLGPEDRLLDIGCNVGNLLIPLSFLVGSVTGVDHANCLEKLRTRYQAENLRLLPGNFLEVTIDEHFDKILCYSVLHYLADEREVDRFLSKALRLLAPGGKALFGDVPNQSRKERFLNSEQGNAFERQWQERVNKKTDNHNPQIELVPDHTLVQFDDELLLQICGKYRNEGFDCYILPQPSHLPFGNTREDILFIRPA
jgi:2-polyprenyl-3-methyl-5-hydroxy-6-metoxy-1,4-benzoquinol methylase